MESLKKDYENALNEIMDIHIKREMQEADAQIQKIDEMLYHIDSLER